MFSFLLGKLASLGMLALSALSELTDKELVSLAQKQDADGKRAFEILVKRHQPWLGRLLGNLVNNKSDVEEVLQNTFVRAFFALPKFRGDASFKTWLRVIASREAFNHYRRYGNKPEYSSETIEETTPDDRDSDQERFGQRDALVKALAKVPYPYREILVLRYVEELSLEEIGESLELGKSATKMRLKRAREFFKDAYDKNVSV